MLDLTPKQEAFAQAYHETGNASEAYRRAYNAGNMKEETIWRKAKEVADNGKVTARLSELQERAQKRHDISIDTITKMLKEDRELAREKGQSSAAVNAVMGMAKIHGLLVDKQEQTGPNGGPVQTYNRVEYVVVHPKS